MNNESDTLIRPYITPSKPVQVTNQSESDYSLGHVLPEYLMVDVMDPVRQWKINHESEMFEQLISSQKDLRETQHAFKHEISNMLRKVPIDLITREFLNKEKLTIDGRAYIIDKLLPVVVLGLEKVLIEADRRGLVEKKEIEPNFNPVDFLGQYLMRNNPLFSNYNEASPYVRGLRQVVAELKVEIFQLSDNKLARVKAEAETKRDERAREEARKKREARRRIEIYQQLFDQFLVRTQTKVDYETVHVSIKSFSEIVAKFPPEMKSKLAPILTLRYSEINDTLLSRKDFGLLISHYADDMPLDIFDQFAEHLSKCAQLYRAQMEKDIRRKLLSELFVTCDLDEMGLLDRQRILMLFDQFYTNTPDNIKMMLRDPRHWPISDYKEIKPAPPQDQNLNNDQTVGGENANNEENNANNDPEIASEDANAEEEVKDKEMILEEEIDVDKIKEVKVTFDSTEENIDEGKGTIKEDITGEIVISNIITEDATVKLEANVKNEGSSNDTLRTSDNSRNERETDVQGVNMTNVDKVEEDLEEKSVHENSAAEDVNATLNDMGDIESHSFSEDEEPTSDRIVENLNREITKLSTITSMSAPYDEENITFPQFFQVTEEFLGDSPTMEVLEDLIEFLREGYQETGAERLKRLQKAHRMVISARRKNVINDLFNVWDRDDSGFLSMKEVAETLGKFRNGSLKEGAKAAKKEARMRQSRVTKDIRLNKKDFRTFIYTVARVSEMLDEEAELETMVNYFIGLVQKTYEEKLRGEARKKWLSSIQWASEISCGSMEGVYRAVFQALYKDAEMHGCGKIISVSIALLENNEVEVHKRGIYTLHFVAATTDQCDFVVGKKLDRSMKNISFQVVYTGNIVSLTHTTSSPLVVYWNPSITESAKEGSLVIVPVKDDLQRVFGVMSVDTLNDPTPDKAVFHGYEISFFQGVSKEFSTAFQHVEMLRRLVKISDSAMIWICRRTESVKGANFYLRERKDNKTLTEFVLRHVLSATDRGEVTKFQKPPRIDKGDNLFKMYLFDTIETSQSTTADAYGDRNLAIPLRDLEGTALGVMEINIGSMKSLPNIENQEVAKMMTLLQQSFNEIIKLSLLIDVQIKEPDPAVEDLSPELKPSIVSASGGSNVDIMFDQYMLAELRSSVARLDGQAYAEIKSYKDPPVTIHAIIQASLALIYPKEGHMGVFENWEKCKKYISLSLSKLIMAFDPFGDISMIPMNVVRDAMKKIPRSEIDRHSSKPALDLYNWVFCCVTLIDHCQNNL